MKINTDAIFSLPVKLILGGKSRQLDDPTYKRLRFLCFAFLVAVVYAGALLISDWGRNSKLAVGLDALIVICSVLFSLLIRWSTAYRLVFHLSVIVVAIVIPTGYFAPTGNRTVFLTPLVLIVAYFLLGRVWGVFWTVAILLANLLAYELSRYGVASIPVSDQSLAYSSLAIGMISVLLFIYEGANISNERRIAERDKRLQTINAELNRELAKRYKLTVQLTGTLQATEKSNRQLEEAKRTLTEALENTNRLRDQLSFEKESVEQQVALRTHQLQEEQARLQASIATLELGFLMTLQNSPAVTYNPALLRICELPADLPEVSILPRLREKLQSSYDLQGAINKCMAEGKSFEAADIAIGDKFIRILGSAIHLEDSPEPLGVVLLIEDMTAAKLLERSENEFVAIASHELRTPLTIIQGNLSIMEDKYPEKFTDQGFRHMIDALKDSSARMILIVNQFLNMTKLEQKKATFDLDAIDLMKTVNETLTSLKPLIDDKNLQLRVEISPRLPKVKADASRVQEVLANLVGNAIKYTTVGYIAVSASHDHNDNHVTIRVKDTGKGIALKNQKFLFHKFQQATDNIFTRDDSHSTGLGLYISRLLVEQMGGSIVLEHSAPNEGSTFSFTLPEA